MPTSQEIEQDKAVLTDIFCAAGITDITLRAQRRIPTLFDPQGDDYLAARASMQPLQPDTPFTLQDYYSYGPLELQGGGGLDTTNVLHLVPSRSLAREEVERFYAALGLDHPELFQHGLKLSGWPHDPPPPGEDRISFRYTETPDPIRQLQQRRLTP